MTSFQVLSLVLVSCSLLVLTECACPAGFLHFRESCYWFSDIEANFPSARSYCGFLRSGLAVITSKEEDDFIRGIANNKTGSFWLGATNLAGGTWLWEGGSQMTYDNYNSNHPENATGENCLGVASRSGHKWHDWRCDDSERFICEKCFS